jgi:serine/threonine-protein kinase
MGLASAPLDSEGARALLQQRLSLLGRVAMVIGAVIQLLVRVLRVLAEGSLLMTGSEWTANVHLLVIAVLAVVWLRTRSGRRSMLELGFLDVVCVAAPITFSLFALWPAPFTLRPNLLQVLGLSNVLILRAVLIPSSSLCTGIFGLVGAATTVGWTYLFYAKQPIKDVASPAIQALSMATWCAITIIISSLASHILFGLRERIRETAQLGQYTLLRKIGAGGMGVVYEARHSLLRRRTALKLLPPTRAGEQNIARFEREVQLTAGLTHPNTIAIFDYGRSPNGVFYYVMEYLDGVDLQALVEKRGAQPPELVAHVLEQVCGALAEAHAIGLIHRDIKPANIILCRRGGVPCVAKVVDFGLVRNISSDPGEAGLSATDIVLGTPLYLSPEAIANPKAVDGRSDLYALGAVGYYLLAGVPPFGGSTTVEVAAHHLHTKAEAPSLRLGRNIAPDLEEVLLLCLQKDPAARPGSALELSAAIRRTAAAAAFSRELAEAVSAHCDALALERERSARAEGDTAVDRTGLLTVELQRRTAGEAAESVRVARAGD